MSEKPFAFHDLPATAFPFKIEMFTRDGRVVHEIEVTGPGAIEVPGLAAFYGPTGARIRYADGRVEEHAPWEDK